MLRLFRCEITFSYFDSATPNFDYSGFQLDGIQIDLTPFPSP